VMAVFGWIRFRGSSRMEEAPDWAGVVSPVLIVASSDHLVER
jgi:hypothetical protein